MTKLIEKINLLILYASLDNLDTWRVGIPTQVKTTYSANPVMILGKSFGWQGWSLPWNPLESFLPNSASSQGPSIAFGIPGIVWFKEVGFLSTIKKNALHQMNSSNSSAGIPTEIIVSRLRISVWIRHVQTYIAQQIKHHLLLNKWNCCTQTIIPHRSTNCSSKPLLLVIETREENTVVEARTRYRMEMEIIFRTCLFATVGFCSPRISVLMGEKNPA